MPTVDEIYSPSASPKTSTVDQLYGAPAKVRAPRSPVTPKVSSVDALYGSTGPAPSADASHFKPPTDINATMHNEFADAAQAPQPSLPGKFANIDASFLDSSHYSGEFGADRLSTPPPERTTPKTINGMAPSAMEPVNGGPAIDPADVHHQIQAKATDAARSAYFQTQIAHGVPAVDAHLAATNRFPDSDDPIGDTLKLVREHNIPHEEARSMLATAQYQAGQRQQRPDQVMAPETRPGYRQLANVVGGVTQPLMDVAKAVAPETMQPVAEAWDAATKTPGAWHDIALRAPASVAPYVVLPGGPAVQAIAAGVGGVGEARGEIAQRRAEGQEISPGQELAAATGQGLVNAALMKTGLGAGEKTAAAVGGGVVRKAAVAIPATGAEMAGVNAAGNVASNAIAASTYDPNRDLTAGTKAAVIGGLASGVPFGLHGAMQHRGEASAILPEHSKADRQSEAVAKPHTATVDQLYGNPQQQRAPWQQSRDEFVRAGGNADQHRAAVNDALAQGKPVAPEVLRDYAAGNQPKPTLPEPPPRKAVMSVDELYGSLRDVESRRQPRPVESPANPQGHDPWQMRREDYVKSGGTDKEHKLAVDARLSAGGDVPAEVLRDYVRGESKTDTPATEQQGSNESSRLVELHRRRDEIFRKLSDSGQDFLASREFGAVSDEISEIEKPLLAPIADALYARYRRVENVFEDPEWLRLSGLHLRAENALRESKPIPSDILAEFPAMGKRVPEEVLRGQEGKSPAATPANPLTRASQHTPASDVATETAPDTFSPASRTVKAKRPPKPFSKLDIERQLMAWHEQMGGGYSDEMHDQVHGKQNDFFAMHTFHKGLPGEVKSFIESNPAARRLFRVTDDPTMSGGADAMAELGDKYWTIAEAQSQSRSRVALEAAKKSNDPQIQLLAALHENMPPRGERRPQTIQDPRQYPTGTTFELHGSKFEIIEDGEGHRLLKDGDEYPIVPLDAIDKLPIDKGTLDVPASEDSEANLPDAPAGAMFDDLHADEPAPRAQLSTGTAAAGGKTGLFGQPDFDARPGGQETFGFKQDDIAAKQEQGRYDRRATDAAQADREALAEAESTKDKETGEMFTGDQPARRRPGGAPSARVGSPTWEGITQQDDNLVWRVWGSELGTGPAQERANLASFDPADVAAARERLRKMYSDEGSEIPAQFQTGQSSNAPASYAPAELRSMSLTDLRDVAESHGLDARGIAGGIARENIIGRIVELQKSRASAEQRGTFHERVNIERPRENPIASTEANKPAPKQPDPRAEVFRRQAESMTAQIENKRREMTQNSTPKRMREYRARLTEGDQLERIQKALHALADAREAGTLPPELENVRSKVQIANLVAKKMKTNGGYYDAYYELPEYENDTPVAKALQGLLEKNTPEQRKIDADRVNARKLIDLEDKVRRYDIPGFFPTPKSLAEKMATAADIRPGDKVLEPSAGKGDLVDAIKSSQPGASVETVETNPDLREILQAKGHTVAGTDFLQHTGQYDRIVMNPPFEHGQDADHVRHAYEQLKPGGKLVSVMSEGTFSRSDNKSAAFREWLDHVGGTSEQLPEDAFAGKDAFKRTGARARLVTVDKGGDAKPPTTGKLDQLENWARKKLDDLGGPGLRGGIPFDPSSDPQRMAYLAIIGAAKLAKGVRDVATWTREMLKEFPDLAKEHLPLIWRDARRVHSMDEEVRGEWFKSKVQIPQSEKTLTTVRRTTGQQPDTARSVREVDALEASMRAMARGSRAGYQSAVEQGAGLRKELARIANETLPPEVRGELLSRVAKLQTLAGLRHGITKIREVLADHDARQAIASAEKLVGTMKLDPIQGPKLPPVQGPNPRPPQTFDLTKLAPEYRDQVRPLLAKAKGLKFALTSAKTIDAKYNAIDELKDTENQLREIATEDQAKRELKIGDKLVQRENVVADLTKKIGAPPEQAGTTNEPPKDASMIRRWFGRGSLSMETIASHIDPDKGDSYDVTIHQIRRAQEDFYGEQQRWNDHIGEALSAAGYEPGSKKLDDFMNERKTIALPDVGNLTLNRNQMVGLVAGFEDPETLNLVRRGVGWTFRTNPLATPFVLTEKDFNAVRDQLTPGERSLIPAFKDYNKSKITDRLMQASINLKGHAPEPHDGYFPRARNRQQNISEGVPTGWKAHFNEALENISSLKERAPDLRQPLMVPDFLQDAYSYIDDAGKLMHLAEPVRNVAMTWEDPRVKASIQRRFGDSMNKRVQNYLADTMQVRQRPPAEWYDKASRFITRNVSRAWLQANPSPMLKNVFGGTVKLMPLFDPRDYAHGVNQMFSRDVFKRMTSESSVAYNRYNGGLYSQYSPLTGKHVESVAELKFTEALKAAAGKAVRGNLGEAASKVGSAVDALPFMEWADSVPFRVAYAASEHFVDRTQPGLSPEARRRAVLDKFHSAVYDSQNGTSSTEVSGLASSARKNALAAPLFLFTSDNNKSYNMLARSKNAGAKTKAATALVVGVNAALNGLIGYGIKSAATAAGQAIGGTQEDPEELHKRRVGTAWDVAQNLLGTTYFGDKAVDVIRAIGGSGDANIATPNDRLETDTSKAVTSLVRAIRGYSATVDGSPEELAATNRLHKAIGDSVAVGQTALGLPSAPWSAMLRRAIQAGTYKAPDPREAAAKKRDADVKAWRAALPGRTLQLLAAKTKLDSYGAKKLDPMELKRYDELAPVEQTYQRYIKAMSDGDTAEAADARRVLIDAGAGKLPKMDERLMEKRQQTRATDANRAGLPKPIQSLLAEKTRLDVINRDKLTEDEQMRREDLREIQTAYMAWQKALREDDSDEAEYQRGLMDDLADSLNGAPATATK